MGETDMEQDMQSTGDAGTSEFASDYPTIEVVDQSDIPHHPAADPDAVDPTREMQDQPQ